MLLRKGYIKLARRVHRSWLATPVGRVVRAGPHLELGDHVVIRDAKGRLLVEGYVRTISADDLCVAVYDEGAGWPLSDDERRAYVEKASRSPVRVLLRERRGDNEWWMGIGADVERGHRREDYRIPAANAVLIFENGRRLAAVRSAVLNKDRALHPLLARQLRANPPRYNTEFERRALWSSGMTAWLEDLGYGGARVHMVSANHLPARRDFMLYLSFRIDRTNYELLLPCMRLSEWEPTLDDTGSPAWRMRLRFVDLDPTEESALRYLISRLTAAQAHDTSSPVVSLIGRPTDCPAPEPLGLPAPGQAPTPGLP